MTALRGIVDALKRYDKSSFFRSFGEKIELIIVRRFCVCHSWLNRG
jgi:hypothetical protein